MAEVTDRDIMSFNKSKKEEMILTLYGLIDNWENEVIEFKEAEKDYDRDKIGRYFSALSNEANLRGLQYGWLVFGVNNKERKIVGTGYRNSKGLDTLKHEIGAGMTGGMSFIDIYEIFPVVDGVEKRVVMFQIPAAVTAIPTGWHNQEYARDGESLVPLSEEKRERIRRQVRLDWSKRFIPNATMEHLDKAAISIAREKYKQKMDDLHISAEVDKMSDEEFLERRKLVINGRVTNAAMLLLGNSAYDYLFESVPEASWRIYDSKEMVKDYEIYKIPFITLGDRILKNIRNLTYRYMPDQMTLFPMETKQYDTWVLRELLNNCIAHSDYNLGGRIYVNEFEDKLILTNPGSFIPEGIEPILNPGYTSPFYRNQLLAEAMVMFKMIDTETTGIRRVFHIQRERFFPLPDYDITSKERVEVTIYGKEINEKFTYLLHDNDNLNLVTVYLLDQVQKGKQVSKEAAAHLRKHKLVEGRVNNLYLSAPLAKTEEDRVQYIKNKAFDDKYYQDMVVNYLRKFGEANRAAVRDLLIDKFPDTLSPKQKERKVLTLLTALKRNGIITTDSENKRIANWILTDNGEND
jgi:ATP-dependent DNA helicase RecG